MGVAVVSGAVLAALVFRRAAQSIRMPSVVFLIRSGCRVRLVRATAYGALPPGRDLDSVGGPDRDSV